MSDKETGFIRTQTDEQIKDQIIQQIAKMSQLPSSEVSLDEIALFLSLLPFDQTMYIGTLDKICKKYTGYSLTESQQAHSQTIARRVGEIIQRLKQFNEIAERKQTKCFSYGIFAPAYLEALQTIKDENPIQSEYSSLLAGALTLDTVAEYQAVSKKIFPTAKTFVIDVFGEQTLAAEHFAFANALSLPYLDNSFDSIQTNLLMHMMIDESNQLWSDEQTSSNQEKLFAEFFRVLKPSGTLLMVEGNFEEVFVGLPNYAVKHELRKELTAAGFPLTAITIEQAKFFAKRIDMFRFFASNLLDAQAAYQVNQADDLLLIKAKKTSITNT